MKRWGSLVTGLGLVVVVACTSPEEPPQASASDAGASSTASWTYPSATGGSIVFDRATSSGIAVYELDLGAGEERKIRDTDDFVTMSPDGSSFVDAVANEDGNVVPATFDIDGVGYAVMNARRIPQARAAPSRR